MKRSLLLCISFIVCLTAPLLDAAEAAEPSGHETALQEILILNSYHPGYAWSDDEQAGIIEAFQENNIDWLPVIEYLDLKRLPDGRHLAELKQLFRRKYQDKMFSVVIAMDNPALEFAIDNQAELFRNAPIVFCGINNYSASMLKGHSEVTGIVEAIDIPGTIEVMLRLHPATQEIFSPHDYTATGLAVRKELEALAPRFGKVRFRFTDPLTMEELLKELERLPKDSLVLEIGFITDKSGRAFDISETTKLFSKHSPVPIYSTYEQRLDFGIVGGKLFSARHHGTHAARIALRVLAGEKASTIPFVFESDSQFMFDYKVMSRFGIPLSALPEHSTVINKPISFYAAHRVVIQTALGIIVFMAVVISLLTINIIQRRRSAEVIRRSEELFRAIASSTPDHLLVMDSDLRYSFVMNPQMGLTEQDMIGKTDHDFLSKEDADKLTEIKSQVLKTGSTVKVEVPLMSSTGGQQFFDGSYVPKFDAKGRVDGLIGYFRNVTERKRAEEALRKSEERLRFHTDNSPMAVVEWNTDLIVTRWTGAAEKMFGWSFEETIGKLIMELRMIYEEDIPIVQSVIQRLTDGKSKHVVSSNRNYTKKGEVIHCEWYNSVLHDSAGKMISVMSQVLDITQRKHAEKELRRAEENFRRSLDESPLGVRIVTIEGETIYTNRAILDIYGYDSIEELNTIPVKMRYTPESYAEFQIRREKRKRGDDGPSEYEISIVRKDGEVRHLQVLRKEILWDGKEQFQVVYQDITERKQAEEALRESEEKFKSMAEASPMSISVYNGVNGNIEYINKRAIELFGYALEDMPTVVKWYSLAYPDGKYRKFLVDEWEKRSIAAMETKSSIKPMESIVNCKDGSAKTIEWGLVSMGDTNIAYGLDITERKQAEEALSVKQAQLQAILDYSPALISIKDLNGNVILANRNFAVLDAPPLHEFVGKNIFDLFPREVAEKLWNNDQLALKAGSPVETEEVVLHKDGIWHTYLTLKFPVYKKPGQPFGTCAISTDITERKQIEEALKDSEKMYRSLFENMINGFSYCRMLFEDGKPLDFIYLAVNNAFGVLTGLKDVIGRKVTELIPNIREADPQLFEIYGRVSMTGQPECFEMFLKSLHMWFSVSVYSPSHEHFVAVFDVISERKRAEEKLKSSQQQLRDLAERLQEIREEERILVSREIHDVVGGGLTGLKMDLSWLIHNVKNAESDKEQAAFKSRILASSQFVDQMIKETRRISSGLRPPFIDDLGLISAIEWQLSEFTSRTGILHELTTQFEHVNMEKDKVVGVFRIFQETLTNIVRHSRATKVVVVLREEERSLFGDENLVVEIRDNGRGITEEEILDSKSLGLLGMKERTVAFGGQFSIRGEPDGGTTVVLKIPRKKGVTS